VRRPVQDAGEDRGDDAYDGDRPHRQGLGDDPDDRGDEDRQQVPGVRLRPAAFRLARPGSGQKTLVAHLTLKSQVRTLGAVVIQGMVRVSTEPGCGSPGLVDTS
jgi:hypothetical protein